MSALTGGPAVFLDRDGTLIREVGYLSRPEQVEILPGAAAALRALRDYGFKLVVVTNQSAVARGYLSEVELASIHALIKERFAAEEAFLDAIYYCPHHPTEGQGNYRVTCDCRKPKPGMVKQAAEELGLDLASSYLIGDQQVDMRLAKAVGVTGVLLRGGAAAAGLLSDGEAAVAEDLWHAGQWIVNRESRKAERSEQR